MTQTGRRRHLAAALAGTLLSLNADWPAYVLAGAMLGFGLLRGFLSPAPSARSATRAATPSGGRSAPRGAVLTLALYVALFKSAGKLDDLSGAYNMRSAGGAPIARAIEGTGFWRDSAASSTRAATGSSSPSRPSRSRSARRRPSVVALRLLVLRREHEVLPLAVLLMAAVQYVVFKQGADIHVFWPQYFGAYFALAMGAARRHAGPALLAASARLGRGAAPSSPSASRSCPSWPSPATASPRSATRARRAGASTRRACSSTPTAPRRRSSTSSSPRCRGAGTVGLHEGMKATWAQTWALGGRRRRRQPPAARPRARRRRPTSPTRASSSSDLQGQLARGFHVTAVGPFWKVVPGEPAAPIDAYAFVEREPSWWEWYFVSGTEPHRDVVADPWLTWELRTHFGQEAAVPTTPPVTLDQKRIAHNVAVAAGDAPRAAALLAEIERELRPVHAAFDDGTEILGTTFHEGARDLLTIFDRGRRADDAATCSSRSSRR